LATVLFAAIAGLVYRGRLHSPGERGKVELKAALAGYDWLDRDWLFERFLELSPAASQPAELSTPDLPVRLPGGSTARQRRLLDALLGLLDDPSFARTLDGQDPPVAGNSLRLYACLVERHPEWQGDPLASQLIRRVLVAWASQLDGERAALHQALNGLGREGEALVRRLSEVASGQNSATDTRLVWPAAGVALLLRTVLDTRLPAQWRRAHKDNPEQVFPALLAALLLRLSPEAPEAELTPGLEAVCGGVFTNLDELRRTLRPLPLATLADVWLETLAGQRALAPTALHLFRLPEGEGGHMLFGGDAS
jgi:hypothetical protein